MDLINPLHRGTERMMAESSNPQGSQERAGHLALMFQCFHPGLSRGEKRCSKKDEPVPAPGRPPSLPSLRSPLRPVPRWLCPRHSHPDWGGRRTRGWESFRTAGSHTPAPAPGAPSSRRSSPGTSLRLATPLHLPGGDSGGHPETPETCAGDSSPGTPASPSGTSSHKRRPSGFRGGSRPVGRTARGVHSPCTSRRMSW